MISRACKSILRKLLKPIPLHMASQCIAHFLNCLYADVDASEPYLPALMNPEGAAHRPWEMMTPKLLRAQIVQEVHARFRYENISPSVIAKRRIPLLRSICCKVGIQLLAKEKEWSLPWNIFKSDDILNIYPIIKSAEPKV